jgi:N-acetylglucosaminyldiphosphoundecaprenol N-acetyl-beta-D-mannosaminyltransferase
MIDRGKRDVLGVRIDVVDYDGAATRIINAARNHLPLGVSALAVHGVMTGVFDDEHRYRLNRLGLVVPDGQPVRWALRLLHGEALPDRVWGPQLTIEVCRRAAELGLSIYLYGSRPEILRTMEQRLAKDFPGLRLAGIEASKFRRLGKEEHEALDERIRRSGADIVIVGLGCPRQEVFAFEHAAALSRPLLAVGAAFDYYAGRLRRPPSWMQAAGLEWVYRLMQEPARLWRRYLLLNPAYLVLLARQKLGLARAAAEREPTEMVRYG